MKPGCYNCRTGKCYHIDDSNAIAMQEYREEMMHVKDSLTILESAVRMLEERLESLMETQYMEPYDFTLSEEDAQKIKDWVNDGSPGAFLHVSEKKAFVDDIAKYLRFKGKDE